MIYFRKEKGTERSLILNYSLQINHNDQPKYHQVRTPCMSMLKEKNPPAVLPAANYAQVATIIAGLNSKDHNVTPNSTTKEQQIKSANFSDLVAEGTSCSLAKRSEIKSLTVKSAATFYFLSMSSLFHANLYREIAAVTLRRKEQNEGCAC